MLEKLARLFQIKTRFEAFLVIYAIALGACERGRVYLDTYPGKAGWMLALACTGVVFIAGAKILDSLKLEGQLAARPARVLVRPTHALPRRAARRAILAATVRSTGNRPRALRRAG